MSSSALAEGAALQVNHTCPFREPQDDKVRLMGGCCWYTMQSTVVLESREKNKNIPGAQDWININWLQTYSNIHKLYFKILTQTIPKCSKHIPTVWTRTDFLSQLCALQLLRSEEPDSWRQRFSFHATVNTLSGQSEMETYLGCIEKPMWSPGNVWLSHQTDKDGPLLTSQLPSLVAFTRPLWRLQQTQWVGP